MRPTIPFLPAVMARVFFKQISSYLHTHNIAELQENTNDELSKSGRFFSLIVERWRSISNLGETIPVDEGLMKWAFSFQTFPE